MENQRTKQQNRALHKYFKEIADDCRSKGISVQMLLADLPDAEISMNEKIIKDIWKVFQNETLGKEHTADLTAKQVNEILEDFSMFMATKYDITMDFPSIESIMARQRLGE